MKKNILTYNEYNRLVEELNSSVNSDLEIDKRNIELHIKDFNSKKSTLQGIFSKDIKTWEIEAAKIIKDNKYLGLWWKIKKIEHELEVANKTPKSADIEAARSQSNKISELQRDLADAKKEMLEKQQKDIKLLKL